MTPFKHVLLLVACIGAAIALLGADLLIADSLPTAYADPLGADAHPMWLSSMALMVIWGIAMGLSVLVSVLCFGTLVRVNARWLHIFPPVSILLLFLAPSLPHIELGYTALFLHMGTVVALVVLTVIYSSKSTEDVESWSSEPLSR